MFTSTLSYSLDENFLNFIIKGTEGESRQRTLLQDHGVPRGSSRSLPGCLESAEQACCPETRDSLCDQAEYIAFLLAFSSNSLIVLTQLLPQNLLQKVKYVKGIKNVSPNLFSPQSSFFSMTKN